MSPPAPRTPSLSFLMKARKGGIGPNDMTPEELAAAEEAIRQQQIASLRMGQAPTPEQKAALWGRRGAAVGASVSPDVFGGAPPAPVVAQDPYVETNAGRVYTNDPAAVDRIGPTEQSPAQYLANTRRQIEMLAQQKGLPLPKFSEDSSTMVGPDGFPIDLRDQALVAQQMKRMLAYEAPKTDVVDGLVMKAVESDPAASSYMPLPQEIVRQYGIEGVDVSKLSAGEILTLRRMGVNVPMARLRTRRRRR